MELIKIKKEKQSMYLDVTKLLSNDDLLNFVGNRCNGKTYAILKYCIDRFLKCGEEFVYLSRYMEEIKDIKNFFDDIKRIYPNHKIKVLGKNIIIDGTTAGCIMFSHIFETVE